MKSFKYIVTDPEGIHARPAVLLIKELKKFFSTITITKDKKTINALKFIPLIGMKIKQGDIININIEGVDEEIAAIEIENFLKTNNF